MMANLPLPATSAVSRQKYARRSKISHANASLYLAGDLGVLHAIFRILNVSTAGLTGD